MDILSRVNMGIKIRKSGDLTYQIDNLKSCLEIMDGIDTGGKNNFYLSWYRDYLKHRLTVAKINQYIPGLVLPGKFKWATKNAVNKLVKNGRIILKDINLPLPENVNEYDDVMHMITDSILFYLLSDIDQDTLYSLYSHILFWTEGLYEYKKVRLEKGDIVIDAGANIGDFSALAGVKGCRAYAFEPIPNVINSFLAKTAAWNPNITLCEYALSDKIEELYFDEDTKGLMGSSCIIKLPPKESRKVKIQAIDLDTFVDKNNLPHVDFIKADIEGAERYMLMGARRVLKEFAPKIVICTYHLPDDPQVLRELILDSNPDYIIEEKWKKMYAYVPN